MIGHLEMILGHDFLWPAEWTYDQVLIHTLELGSLKLSHRFLYGSHAFAMFPDHFTRVCVI